MSSVDNASEGKPKRKRGLTELTLGWLAERMRKAETIKEKIAQGEYKVDSEKIAASIVNKE